MTGERHEGIFNCGGQAVVVRNVIGAKVGRGHGVDEGVVVFVGEGVGGRGVMEEGVAVRGVGDIVAETTSDDGVVAVAAATKGRCGGGES